MIKILIGFVFIIVDMMFKISEGNATFDLLPDYIGYVIVIWGFWGIRKRLENNEEADKVIKKGMLICAIMFVVSYVLCLLDLHGLSAKFGTYVSLLLGLLSDVGMIVMLYFYITMLEKLQGANSNFQIKRMMNLVKIMCLCIACQYVSFSMSMVMATFIVFEMIVAVILMMYMVISNMTYKEKFLKKDTKEKTKRIKQR